MAVKIFGNLKSHGPLAAATLGIGLALTACAALTCGAGSAAAAPQQPFLADDPTAAAPVPAGPDPTTAVNVANAILKQLNSVLNVVLPGSGALMPQSTPTPAPAAGIPSLATQQPGVLPGYPSSVLPGATLTDTTAQTSLDTLTALPPGTGFTGN